MVVHSLMRIFLPALILIGSVHADIQTSSPPSGQTKGPVVSVPTRRNEPPPTPRVVVNPALRSNTGTSTAAKTQPEAPKVPTVIPRSRSPIVNGVYPWRKNITATVFWVGESATQRNPVSNDKSSWDSSWQDSFGGFDDPDPAKRGADGKRPAGFIPKQNPFYVALPYNDVSKGRHKPEASRVIPWFNKEFERPGKSVCKGRWVQIWYNGKYCFAQWEDCGPFTTEDWEYVFCDSPPKNKANYGAGIDISPAVRDHLGIKGGHAVVDWRFVDFERIRPGPWSHYGENNPFQRPELNPKNIRTERLKRQREGIEKRLLQSDIDKLRREMQG